MLGDGSDGKNAVVWIPASDDLGVVGNRHFGEADSCLASAPHNPAFDKKRCRNLGETASGFSTGRARYPVSFPKIQAVPKCA